MSSLRVGGYLFARESCRSSICRLSKLILFYSFFFFFVFNLVWTHLIGYLAYNLYSELLNPVPMCLCGKIIGVYLISIIYVCGLWFTLIA